MPKNIKKTKQRAESHNNIERATLSNFVLLLKNRQFKELFKVLRRRILNSLKVFKRAVRKIVGYVYDQPFLKIRRQKKVLKNTLQKFYDFESLDIPRNTKKITVALILRDGQTSPKSSAFIRLIGPLTRNSIRKNVQIKIFPENTTTINGHFDVCIVQRTAYDSIEDAHNLVNSLNASGTILVVDTDDAFAAIPKDHPEFTLQSQRLEAKYYLLKSAHQVWASTMVLKSSFDKAIRNKTTVIPNGLDDRLWRSQVNAVYTQPSGNEPIRLVYMGTATHDADLKMIMPALDKLASDYPGSFSLTLIGVTDNIPDNPWLSRTYLKTSMYPQFVQWFTKSKRFDIGLSPLEDTEFNQGKSDIKCLDYLAAGILPVVSDVMAYSSTDLNDLIVRSKNTTDDWKINLENLIVSPQTTRSVIGEKVAAGQKYIWNNRSSNQTAGLLYKQLKKILDR